jgi:predicted aspartyl protease
LEAGAFSIAFASSVGANELAPCGRKDCADSPAPVPPATPIATKTDAANYLTVAARVNGKGPYRFIIDTGADRTILATEVAVELGLVRGERVILDGVVQTILADTVSLRELTLGSITRKDMKVPTLPRALLDADGYLGLDYLDGHRVTFDFKNHLLKVSDPRPRFSVDWMRDNEARINTFGPAGHLRSLDCRVDGVSAAAFIDSGAEVSAANAPLLAALAKRNPAFGEIGNISLVDITGGEIAGKVVVADRIQLPGLAFEQCPLVVANFQVFKVWGLTHSPALLIGMNLLRQFARVSVDYGLKELRFDLATSPVLPQSLQGATAKNLT